MNHRGRMLRTARRVAAVGVATGWFTTLAWGATTPAPTSSTPHAGTSKTVTPAKPGTGPKRPAATTAPARATARAKAAAGPQRSTMDQAHNARSLEDIGAYGQAADGLRALRKIVKRDVDLEVELALDEARSGRADSALARLSSPLVMAAIHDSMPLTRRAEYPYQRETFWLNGRFDGWHWYIVRARAELELKRGNWKEALEWARQSVQAWPLNGKDWHILSLCAAHAGAADEAREAAAQAVLLDPTLPEARYLAGIWAWRDGKRNEAAESFRRAISLDSSYAAPALAMLKVRLPGAQPDTFPASPFVGIHQVALLTSSLGPKPEEFVQVDTPASLDSAPDTAVTDSIPRGVKPYRLYLSVLVDENGYPVLNHVAWYPAAQLDFRKVLRIIASTPGMRFHPATRLGRPQRLWVSLDYDLKP